LSHSFVCSTLFSTLGTPDIQVWSLLCSLDSLLCDELSSLLRSSSFRFHSGCIGHLDRLGTVWVVFEAVDAIGDGKVGGDVLNRRISYSLKCRIVESTHREESREIYIAVTSCVTHNARLDVN
jgi:hypothetical protein